MKTLFITVSEGSIARNILRSFVLEALLRDPEISVVLLALHPKAQLYEKEFGSERVRVIAFRPRTQSFFDRLLLFLGRNGLRTETIMADQRTYLFHSKRYVSFILKRMITRVWGRSRIFHLWLRWLASFRAPTPDMRDAFVRFQPSLLFATDVQDEFDIDAMRAARGRGVAIVGMVRSWDNPTSHHLIQIVPKTLAVWSPYVKARAMELHHIPEEQIVVTGIPHFDWYRRRDVRISRAEFLKPYGIRESEAYIFFGGNGNESAPHEKEVVKIISDAISAGKIRRAAKVLYRPHPNFPIERDFIRALPHVVFDDAVAHYTGAKRSSWEMDREKMVHLVNSLLHADVALNTASTIAVDAAAFDRPIICIGFDGTAHEPYWNSVARYYRDYTHYIYLIATRGLCVVHSPEECIEAINSYLENPSLDREGRARIRDEFIGPLDGHSAQRLADVVLSQLKGR